MNKNEFVQFSMADGHWWIWKPIIASGKKLGYRKVRLATDEEITYEKLRDN